MLINWRAQSGEYLFITSIHMEITPLSSSIDANADSIFINTTVDQLDSYFASIYNASYSLSTSRNVSSVPLILILELRTDRMVTAMDMNHTQSFIDTYISNDA